MVFIHPTLCSKPAACAKLEMATGLRADSFITRSGNYLVALVNPSAIKPAKPTPKAKATGRRIGSGDYPAGGGDAA